MNLPLIEPFILAAAAAITIAVSYCASMFAAQSNRFLDHPNERSSHSAATPRIGGLAIVGAWMTGLFVVSTFSSNIDLARIAAVLALFAASALGVGLMDDRFGLAPLWKFTGQIAVAAAFVVVFGPFQELPMPYLGDALLPPAWGVAITIIWIAGFMNVFNFMDGANGLAGGTAAVGFAWISIIAVGVGANFLFVASFLLALAATGFLPQNLKRGRLFMGDNGSQALGFLIAAFAVLGANWTGGRMSALVVPAIFIPLIFDVAWTLASRLLRGQNVLRAHREHLYQLMIRSGMSHSATAVIYMGFTNLSAAAAIWMLALPHSLQWLAPALLTAVFGVGAALIHARASSKGLLSRRHAAARLDAVEIKTPSTHVRAAE